MNDRNDYKKVFEIVSPTGDDERFIADIIKLAKNDNRREIKHSQRPIYVLSAALVAVIVLAAVTISFFGNAGNNVPVDTAPKAADNDNMLYESKAVNAVNEDIAEFEEAVELEEAFDLKELDPYNPYNLEIKKNTFDDLDIRIADIRGDKNLMYVLVEVINDEYFTDIEELSALYPDADYWDYNVYSLEHAENPEIGSNEYTFNVTNIVEEGRFFWRFNISKQRKDSIPIVGKDINFIIYASKKGELLYDADGIIAGIYKASTVLHTLAAKFTANYIPSSVYTTEFYQEFEEDTPVVGLYITESYVDSDIEKIEISEYTVSIYGSERGAGWNHNYDIKFNDGTIATLHKTYSIKYNMEKENLSDTEQNLEKYSFDGYVEEFLDGRRLIRFYFDPDKSIDIKTIEAIIIDGVEYTLDW
ncbi:MAG: hypothetical protein FWF94_03160 [Oscillospiraceae bacterium]|nr:hypothetical protein [Oscillospiraceae bacterium]